MEVDDALEKGPRENADPDALVLLIVSDNHMKKDGLASVLARYADEVDYFLHCGDSNLEHNDSVMRPFICVKGNTDVMQQYPEDAVVPLLNGQNVLIVHGHRHRVSINTDELLKAASLYQSEPEILLYGHTHCVDVQLRDGRLIVNPGSISSPRDGIVPTYAKLLITPEAYDVQIFNAKTHEPFKAFQFQR